MASHFWGHTVDTVDTVAIWPTFIYHLAIWGQNPRKQKNIQLARASVCDADCSWTRSIDDVVSVQPVQVQRQPQHRGPRSPTTRPPMFARPGGPAPSALARALAPHSPSRDRPVWLLACSLRREDLDDWG